MEIMQIGVVGLSPCDFGACATGVPFAGTTYPLVGTSLEHPCPSEDRFSLPACLFVGYSFLRSPVQY